MLASALALLLAVQPASAYPPEGAMALATTGLVLPPAGAVAVGGLAVAGVASGDEDTAFGLSMIAVVAGLPALAAGPPLLAAGSLRAQSVLADRGRHVSSAPGWLSVACYVGMLAVPELMRTPDGDLGGVSAAAIDWTYGVLYVASYATGVAQYVTVRRAWTPARKAQEQRALEHQFQRVNDSGEDERREEEPNPEPPKPPNPEPPLPVATSWVVAPTALPGGGAGVALLATF